VADVWGMQLTGFVAWPIWSIKHIFRIIEFRNRFLVFLRWTWSYLTYQRGARLIASEQPPATVAPDEAPTTAR
jgi:NADH dehydrogenase